MAFHNPYHFVPVKKGRRHNDLSRQDFENGQLPETHRHVTHDRYTAGQYSGRIICRLTTEAPLVVGAEQDPRTPPAKVRPYELDGRPAIPASTLRGLISGIVEAATNSALRVLDGRKFYSFRKPILDRERMLSALGMIIQDGKDKFRLRPLTLPTIQASRGNPVSVDENYAGLYPAPNLKVYLNQNGSYRTFRKDSARYYYLKLHTRVWDGDNRLADDNYQRWKAVNVGGVMTDRFLLAQNPTDTFPPRPLTQEEFAKLTPPKQGEYTRGILRVLGGGGREMPNTKKHEVFIPFPKEAEDESKWPSFEIPDEVVERFYLLADQRTDEVKKEIREKIKRLKRSEASDDVIAESIEAIKKSLLPYEPFDTVRNRNPDGEDDFTFRLKDGDLVYFRSVRKSGPVIAEIALSAVWRDRVESREDGKLKGATAHTFFGKVDPELVPFNQTRTQITLAEQLFGFVEELEQHSEQAALGLAGRIYPSPARFVGSGGADADGGEAVASEDSFYLWDEQDAEGWTTLKILSSPKPPSPAMYFKMKNSDSRYIPKNVLDPGEHEPQGRKFYLHHRPSEGAAWKSHFIADDPANNVKADLAQKLKVRPIKVDAVFYFHLDFENLHEHELGALLYALRPTRAFRHKVGLGKSIGLGRVRVDPVGLLLVNRLDRYSSAGLFAPRYDKVWHAADQSEWPWPETTDDVSDWPEERYKREATAVNEVAGGSRPAFAPQTLHEAFRQGMDPDIRFALELIGDPTSLRSPVRTPALNNQLTRLRGLGEKETFEWFVANDKAETDNQQSLKPLKAPAQQQANQPPKLPTLD